MEAVAGGDTTGGGAQQLAPLPARLPPCRCSGASN